MSGQIWLFGSLAGHRRGLVLEEAVGASAADERPGGYGICLLFATDFQEGESEFRRDWLAWTERPGRVLLLVPPFAAGSCAQPIEWEAMPRRDVKPRAERGLARTLATEVRHELRGSFQMASEINGVWDDYSVNTAYWRRHPHSGVFAITCLPIWSMTVLDHPNPLRSWLDELQALAGTPPFELFAEPEPEPDLRPDHYTLLLHMLSGHFADREDALTALKTSTIFRFDPSIAGHRYDELNERGLVAEGQLTERGREAVGASDYAIYAEELIALRDK